MGKRKHKKSKITKPHSPKRQAATEWMIGIWVTVFVVTIAVVDEMYDAGKFDKWITPDVEDTVALVWVIGGCALYLAYSLDQHRFIRRHSVWAYAVIYLLLASYRGKLVHLFSPDWQDAAWLVLSVLKFTSLFGFVHLAFLQLRKYYRSRYHATV